MSLVRPCVQRNEMDTPRGPIVFSADRTCSNRQGWPARVVKPFRFSRFTEANESSVLIPFDEVRLALSN